jgi:uncharacterized protein with HEPN domain
VTRTPELLLGDILDSIALIERYVEGVSVDRFVEDVQLQDSVIRRLEVIGEAVKNLPVALRDSHPQVRWREVAGLRDILIHQYARVDLGLTWATVTRDLPVFRNQVERILADPGSLVG